MVGISPHKCQGWRSSLVLSRECLPIVPCNNSTQEAFSPIERQKPDTSSRRLKADCALVTQEEVMDRSWMYLAPRSSQTFVNGLQTFLNLHLREHVSMGRR
ncbi:hypothetical protein L1987_55166 [Smallanthus sonchifolius]|uniref:Uncharacterized protein n=1 Tax=Smallanthus sonchifolius TaxID=185202 RepID=A0ACB9E8V9_9ASTR|nr:hypothetical protein L1987_55166 [Smallanthus sonchifolius]